MSVEALLERVAIGLETNTEQLMILNAGREEALAKLTESAAAGGEAPKTTRRKKADVEGNGQTAAAGTAHAGPVAATTSTLAAPSESTRAKRDVDTTDDGLRKLLGGYLGSVENGSITEDEQKRRGALLASAVNQHFGSPAATGPKSTLTDEQRYQLTFFVARWAAGLEVNFSQDYDFDGDPLFDKAAAPAGVDLLG